MLPPYIVEKIKPKQLVYDNQIRAKRATAALNKNTIDPLPHQEVRQLYDSNHKFEFPEQFVKQDVQTHSEEPSSDPVLQVANVIYDHFHNRLNRESFDNENAIIRLYKNFGENYDNAFWDSEHLAFGEGDGTFTNSFLIDDVIAHEYGHAVTDYTARLVYRNQPGALNEHFSDVVGIAIKHLIQSQQPSIPEPNWLLGEGLFNPRFNARGLRDMENPGTAYDHPALGKDPQPAHMNDFYDGIEDEGGVHINSGIPNKAFSTFCKSVNMSSFAKPLDIWYNALLKSKPDTQFIDFANNTVTVSKDILASMDYVKMLVESWKSVGITPTEDSGPTEPDPTDTRICKRVMRRLTQIRKLANQKI